MDISDSPAEEKTISLPGNVKLELVKVEAGTFEMSARDGENFNNEVSHRATLTKDFYIGRTEVTQAQWKAVMGTNLSYHREDDLPMENESYHRGDDLPVENVSWNDAMEFCEKLNETGMAPDGWMFTLPTETQWEYAARGGKKSKGYKYSGSNDIDEVAWYKGNSENQVHPVGQKKANELGLYDMNGNVWEWCLDDYNSDSSKLTAEFTRGNDQVGSLRVRRGGSWDFDARFCRSAHRNVFAPGIRFNYLGFRLALIPAEGYGSGSEATPASTTRQIPSSGQTSTASGSTEQRVQIPPGDKTIALPNDVKLEMMKVEAGTFELALIPAEEYAVRDAKRPPANATQQIPSSGQTSTASGSTEQRVQIPPGDKTIALPNGVKLEMMKVEAGSFTMSARDGENNNDEVAHRATLTKDFYIGRTEVTQAQWEAVMGTNPSDFKGDDLPVEQVSWNDAMEFCEKLNSMGKAPKGWKFSLPTETQWEYAARGGKKSKGYKYSGSDDIDEAAWHDSNSGSKTHPVGQKRANELGLCDMSGNVWEWCLDDWKDKSDKATAEFTRGNDQDGSLRVIRGGSWDDSYAGYCCSTYRLNFHSGLRSYLLGFRVALVPESY